MTSVLPYLESQDFHFGKVQVHPFGTLIAIAVVMGSTWSVRRAVAAGLQRRKIEALVMYMLVFGFVCAHLLQVIMYRPRAVIDTPMELLILQHGMSSFGGFFGALLGGIIWSFQYPDDYLMPYADQIAAILPLGFVFGRAACALAHDHVGRLTTNAWFGVRFPQAGPAPPGLRFDLGILEFFALIPIAGITLWYARKPRPAGKIGGVICLLYSPVRFYLDSLRGRDFPGADVRYYGLTPAQWCAIPLFLFGIFLFFIRTPPPSGKRKPRPLSDAAGSR